MARKHIKEARELSNQLGGTDRDVKQYFYSLDKVTLDTILDKYESIYGRSAREYAERTIPVWQSGEVHMSGQNAARLFALLPAHMPRDHKYGLIESLWKKYSPKSEITITYTSTTDSSEIQLALGNHLNEVVKEYEIPINLQLRFNWLTDHDSTLMKEMLNHFLLSDKNDAVESVLAEVAIVTEESSREETALRRFSRELRVGGHVVHLVMDKQATQVNVTRGKPNHFNAQKRFNLEANVTETSQGCGLIIVVILVVIVIALLMGK